MGEDTITRKTVDFVNEYPFILYALRKGLINYSSLARMIQKETGIENFDAIIVALRRYQDRVKSFDNGKKILNLLRNSALEIRTGVNTYQLKDMDPKMLQRLDHFHLIHGGYDNIDLITDDKMKIEPKMKNLLEVKIKCPQTLETTSGVMAYVCCALADRGINIIKTYGYSNTIYFTFEKRKLPQVIAALESIGIK